MGVEGPSLAWSLLSRVLEPFYSALQLVQEAQLPFLPPPPPRPYRWDFSLLQWLIVLLPGAAELLGTPSPLSLFDGFGTIMDPIVIHFFR